MKNFYKNERTPAFAPFLLMVLIMISGSSVPGVAGDRQHIRLEKRDQNEYPTGLYIHVDRSALQTSPAYRYSTSGFFAVQVNVDDSSRNIVGDAANEPSIAVDPTNPNRMIIGWRQFDTNTNNFRQAGYGYTFDGGLSWTFPGVLEPGIFRSDPVFGSDSRGTFYYNSLTLVNGGSDYECDVFKSLDGGVTWDGGTFAHGGDKQWMVIDKTGGVGDGNIYADWTSNFSICPPGFFTRSADTGSSYEDCITIPDDPFWGTLDVGPEGELYILGAGFPDFVLVKSMSARDSGQVISWDTTISVPLDGEISSFVGDSSPNPGGLLGQGWVAVDRSTGPMRGNVYALCSVQRYSTSDQLDVMFNRSTDGGVTWGSPVKVNDDTVDGAWQWFGTMSVAPNGRIDVIWLDTRDDPGGLNSTLYYSSSVDGGVNWSTNEKLSEPFDPHIGWPDQQKMGDYFTMISDESGANIAWAGTFNGEQDVYYGRISILTGVDDQNGPGIPTKVSLSQNYPNPFNPSTAIKYQLTAVSQVSLKVYDLLGREVATLVNDIKGPGSYQVSWDASDQATGIYFYRLNAGGKVETRKMTVLK